MSVVKWVAGAVAAVAFPQFVTAEEWPATDASSFTTCAACHLQDGAGIPGAFPPLKNRALAIASLDGGREYLIAATTYGLSGQIVVDGMTYFGVMPGNLGVLDDEALAAALNHSVFGLGVPEENASAPEPFTADEIAAYRDANPGANLEFAAGLRKALVETHGDRWP